MSDVEKNKTVVRRYFQELVNGARHEMAAEVLTEGFAFYSQDLAEPMRGRDEFVARLAGNKSAFRESGYVVEEMVGEGDRVAVRLRFEGVHGSGKRVSIPGFAMMRLEGGLIAELWVVTDRKGMEEQLG